MHTLLFYWWTRKIGYKPNTGFVTIVGFVLFFLLFFSVVPRQNTQFIIIERKKWGLLFLSFSFYLKIYLHSLIHNATLFQCECECDYFLHSFLMLSNDSNKNDNVYTLCICSSISNISLTWNLFELSLRMCKCMSFLFHTKIHLYYCCCVVLSCSKRKIPISITINE